MNTNAAKHEQPNMSETVAKLYHPPFPVHPETDITPPEPAEPKRSWLVRTGAMADETSPNKPFWNPAFVGAAGLIFILLTALVGFAVSYTQVKGDGEALRRELADTKGDVRELRQQLADEKEYTRDAMDQITRAIDHPPIRPKPRRSE